MILEIDSIELGYGERKILYGIYLRLEKGKVTGILGRNGCGKTSLMRILFGDLIPKYKNIRLDGLCIKKPLYRSGIIAYLPQHELIPHTLTVQAVFELFHTSWKDFIMEFDSFKIYHRARFGNLSSGERRVISLYLILRSNRKIILLDEPFSFIAPLYVQTFKSIIKKIKVNSILVLTDHFYKDVLDVSDQVYLLKNGCSKIVTSKLELENEGYIALGRRGSGNFLD